MREPAVLSAARRLFGVELRPGRVLGWFTTRRIMVLVAIVAVGLAADAMRRKRDWCLSRAETFRRLESQERKQRLAMSEEIPESLAGYRDFVGKWLAQAESSGATEDAERCRGVLEAIDRQLAESHDGPYREDELAAHEARVSLLADEVARMTQGADQGWKPSGMGHLGPRLRPGNLSTLRELIQSYVHTSDKSALAIPHHARLAKKYERVASHTWESIAPDPPQPLVTD